MLKAERVTFIQHQFFCSLNEDTNMSVALFILDSIPRLKISSSEHSLTNISVIRERRPIPLTIVASYVSSKRSNSSFSVDILFFLSLCTLSMFSYKILPFELLQCILKKNHLCRLHC